MPVDEDRIEVEALAYSKDVLLRVRQRYVDGGYRRAVPEQRFEALMTRFALAYRPETELKPYIGTLSLPGEEIRFRVSARAAFSAYEAAAAHFVAAEGAQLRVQSAHDWRLPVPPPSAHIDVAPLPFSDHVLEMMCRRELTGRRTSRMVKGRPDLTEAEIQEIFERHRKQYREDAPIIMFDGYVLNDGETTSVATPARSMSEAVVAVFSELGEDHRIRTWVRR